jgi:hypothetical protein
VKTKEKEGRPELHLDAHWKSMKLDALAIVNSAAASGLVPNRVLEIHKKYRCYSYSMECAVHLNKFGFSEFVCWFERVAKRKYCHGKIS